MDFRTKVFRLITDLGFLKFFTHQNNDVRATYLLETHDGLGNIGAEPVGAAGAGDLCLPEAIHYALQDGGKGRDPYAGANQNGVFRVEDMPAWCSVRTVHVNLGETFIYIDR